MIPQIEGTVSIRSSRERFLHAFGERVAAGLLTGQPHPRSHYVVSEAKPGHLEIRAADWWTAVNVGLNWVELHHIDPGAIRYRVRYWKWAQFVLCLSGALGLAGVVLLLTVDVRAYVEQHQASMISGMSVEQNVLVAWFMVLFWGFVWPWLLISFHKRPLRRLVARLINEVDAG
ncbi:MAG: hypothetical protein ND807_10355 [Vicinamibacterales bacterium]|nr:hypothetical protein [Vicinamibacterales bacterium]